MPKSDYTPTTSDVAALLRARTRDRLGNIVGDFTDVTNPDTAGATAMITEAVDEVAEVVGDDLPDDDSKAATKRVVVLLAAANIELSYFPEQAGAANSMYDKLMARYNARLASLVENIAGVEEEGASGEPAPEDEFGYTGGFPQPQWWGLRRW